MVRSGEDVFFENVAGLRRLECSAVGSGLFSEVLCGQEEGGLRKYRVLSSSTAAAATTQGMCVYRRFAKQDHTTRQARGRQSAAVCPGVYALGLHSASEVSEQVQETRLHSSLPALPPFCVSGTLPFAGGQTLLRSPDNRTHVDMSASPPPPGRTIDIELGGQEVITVELDSLDPIPDDLIELLREGQCRVWIWTRLAAEYWRRGHLDAAEKIAKAAIESAWFYGWHIGSVTHPM